MKIALCSSYVPFNLGGYRNIVDWLTVMLREGGHQVESIYLPEVDDQNTLFQQMGAFRLLDLEAADRIICFRPQSHLIPHPHKILWFIHHLRVYYDLWDSAYRTFPDNAKTRGFKEALLAADNAALKEAKAIFTNSQVVSSRLKKYNHQDSEVLYPPLFRAGRFHCDTFGDEIVCICRQEHHKRQHLLVDAMRYTKTPVKLRLSGVCGNPDYAHYLSSLIQEPELEGRVIWDNRWISEKEKIELLANCLAAAYLPVDEDSYGYPSLEASHSCKPILGTDDSGGVLELVENGLNGYITEPRAQALAEAMDHFYLDKAKTECMGKNAMERVSALKINWPHVLKRLTA